MTGMQVNGIAGTVAGAFLGMLLSFQAGAQGHSGGARPGGAMGGAAHAGGMGNTHMGIDRGWPLGPEIQAPSRLPKDKAFGKKGEDASDQQGDNASSATAAGANENASADARASASQRDESERGRSAGAPGHTGQTGLARATLRADEHAEAGLEKAQSNQDADEAPDDEADSEAIPPR